MSYVGGVRKWISDEQTKHIEDGGELNTAPQSIHNLNITVGVYGKIYSPSYIDLRRGDSLIVKTDWVSGALPQYPAAIIIFNDALKQISSSDGDIDIDTSVEEPNVDGIAGRREILSNISEIIRDEPDLGSVIEIASHSGGTVTVIQDVNTEDDEMLVLRSTMLGNPPNRQEIRQVMMPYSSIGIITVPRYCWKRAVGIN